LKKSSPSGPENHAPSPPAPEIAGWWRRVSHTVVKRGVGRRQLACGLGSLLAIFLGIWVEGENWNRVAEVRRNSQTMASDRFHAAARVEAHFRKVNSLYFRYSIGVGTATTADIRSETMVFREFLLNLRGAGMTTGQREAVDRLQVAAGDYLQHVEPVLDNPLRGEALLDWRRMKEALFARMLFHCTELRGEEQRALGQYWEDSLVDIVELERSLITSSILLLGIGAAVAVMFYAGVVDPLQRNLRRSQSIIQQQEKLSSLGMLAAGVAHEIRNPLTSIKARLFVQQSFLRRHSEEWEDNVFIAEEISRLERIVRDFLAFARPSDPEFAPVPARAALREAAELLAPELRACQIEVQEEFAGDPVVRADPPQLKQVLINLIRNAVDSIGRNGVITLSCSRQVRQTSSRAAAFGVLSVRDTGKGISAEARQRLFDPFFTTKPNGTGLGLSTAARILEKHGGLLEHESELNRGTRFHVLLPEHSDHDPAKDLNR
jgi:signal transduction histidine kinase